MAYSGIMGMYFCNSRFHTEGFYDINLIYPLYEQADLDPIRTLLRIRICLFKLF